MQGGGILPPEGKQGLAPANGGLLHPPPSPTAWPGAPPSRTPLAWVPHGAGDVGAPSPSSEPPGRFLWTMPAPGLCHQGAPLTGFGGRCHPEWDPGGTGVPAIQPGHKQRRCKGWGQQAGCAGGHHTRAKPGHLPDRDRLVQPAKGKIERVGRGENQRGQRRGARGKRWSWRRGVRAPVGPNGAVKALAGPPRTVLSWLVHLAGPGACPNPAASPVPPWDGCPPAGTRWWDPPRLHPQGTIPAWLLTCTRSSPQGPGAAPSRARCTAETAAGWTCCCRCSLGMAWRKRWH